jgi:hypothetical protein
VAVGEASIDTTADQVCPVVENRLYINPAIAISIIDIDEYGTAGG